MNNSKWISLIFVAFIVITLVLLSIYTMPIPQWQYYHHFADSRTIWMIPNFWNVISNIPFFLVSILGLFALNKQWRSNHLETKEALVFFILFVGGFLVGLGSSYYHWDPDNNSLVWDRLPMTIVFMSLLSLTIMERIRFNLGFWLLIPLIAFGIYSVIYWHQTELLGHGDIRLYALAQFYSIFLIFLILILFPKSYPPLKIYLWMFAFYALAKMTEYWDFMIYDASGLISGHTLKHIFAAISLYFVVVMVKIYPPCNQT